MKNFNLNKFKVDEESEFIVAEIAKLRAQNLKNNIDFEKAELERIELETKLASKSFDNNKNIAKTNKNNDINQIEY